MPAPRGGQGQPPPPLLSLEGCFVSRGNWASFSSSSIRFESSPCFLTCVLSPGAKTCPALRGLLWPLPGPGGFQQSEGSAGDGAVLSAGPVSSWDSGFGLGFVDPQALLPVASPCSAVS